MVKKLHRDIALIGRSCRLPGAANPDSLWEQLYEGNCLLSKIPNDRWNLERFTHSNPQERGKSYTWSAGVIDDPWTFDANLFGISPREAEQMDPQQRLLLELTWHALEDSGISPSSLSGEEVGVYVGASSLDYGNLRIIDSASGDSYASMGNTLSILANRISYCYNLKGPSYAIDTACSSSLVALDAAVEALQSGRIELAIVAGVNLLLSPYNFISFSNAQMLSKSGRCLPFSSDADGYVRAEGGVVLVLKACSTKTVRQLNPYALIAATGINSDGHTVGIAMPSVSGQKALIDTVYGRNGIRPDELLYLEAHGTGTPVGDPIEAQAIGESIGRFRESPLPIGSIKSNIGHTEPVSGLAGLLKAALIFQHGFIPQSLAHGGLNDRIDFEGLNLALVRERIPLVPYAPRQFIGVSSFGFGGTNAHAVLQRVPPVKPVKKPSERCETQVLMLSAKTQEALKELSGRYASLLRQGDRERSALIANAVGYHRELLPYRLLAPVNEHLPTMLFRASNGDVDSSLCMGRSTQISNKMVFVYSGNGAQFDGMGRTAYQRNAFFRECFDRIDRLFYDYAEWSLKEALMDPALGERLDLTSVAQPLIFAISASLTYALKCYGLVPNIVFGHSVGEIAAAQAAGKLTLEEAVKVIYYRSLRQEQLKGQGGMAVLFGTSDHLQEWLAEQDEITVAAYNSPKSFTVSGSSKAIDQLLKRFPKGGLRAKRLDLDYPFHCELMDPIKEQLLHDLSDLKPLGTDPRITMISTFTGSEYSSPMSAEYWWNNIRHPVCFQQAIEQFVKHDDMLFIEIGPNPTLVSHIMHTFAAHNTSCVALGSLTKSMICEDPVLRTVMLAILKGAPFSRPIFFGKNFGQYRLLPNYPMQKTTYRLIETTEAYSITKQKPVHPLYGTRLLEHTGAWSNHLDRYSVVELADHQIGEQVVFPGAGYIEVMLGIAKEMNHDLEEVVLDSFEIHAPLIFPKQGLIEVVVRYDESRGRVAIFSRPRLAEGSWQLHASAKILTSRMGQIADPVTQNKGVLILDSETLYARAQHHGLNYGKAYRNVRNVFTCGKQGIHVELFDPVSDYDQRYMLNPARLDSCFHGLIAFFNHDNALFGRSPYVPVSAESIVFYAPHSVPCSAYIVKHRHSERSLLCDVRVCDARGECIMLIKQMRFKVMRMGERVDLDKHLLTQSTLPACFPLNRTSEVDRKLQALFYERVLDLLKHEQSNRNSGYIFVEGWAIAFALSVLSPYAVPETKVVELSEFSEHQRFWALKLLGCLRDAGLSEYNRVADQWTIVDHPKVPSCEECLGWLFAEHHDLPHELLLLSHLTRHLLSVNNPKDAVRVKISENLKEHYWLRSPLLSTSMGNLLRDLTEIIHSIAGEHRLHLLLIGSSSINAEICRLCESTRCRVTLFEPQRNYAEKARFAFLDEVTIIRDPHELALQRYDLILSNDGMTFLTEPVVKDLPSLLVPGGVCLGVENTLSVFKTLIYGFLPAFDDSNTENQNRNAYKGYSRSKLLSLLNDDAEDSVKGTLLGETSLGESIYYFTREVEEAPIASVQNCMFYEVEENGSGAVTLAKSLAEAWSVLPRVHSSVDGAFIQDLKNSKHVLCPIQFDQNSRSYTELQRITMDCKALFESMSTYKGTVWFLTYQAVGDNCNPYATSVWVLLRTIQNEYPHLDLRRLDCTDEWSIPDLAKELERILQTGTDETELILRKSGISVIRFTNPVSGRRSPKHSFQKPRLCLETPKSGGFNEMRWVYSERSSIDDDEVEIEVENIGLNFRDVMWSLSMLPEEILEDGFAGPRMGLEVSGRVVSVGKGCKTLRPNDRVMAFARSGFTSHLVVPESLAVVIPKDIDFKSATTIPVAFTTAYYGLVHKANLTKGETVLIHGGAGGVGMAGIGIAKMLGARVFATAGTPEKRSLLLSLGVEAVYNSRDLGFVNLVRKACPNGIDVVLNSLSGEAMEQSLRLLKPFGRFIELGKRDYVANTEIGLKPFRRNLTYYGVDLDQVIHSSDASVTRVMQEVVHAFGQNKLSPLPYQSYEADEVSEAFRLMQASAHIGKVIVSPPKIALTAYREEKTLSFSSEGVHIVFGGMGGFGLEMARWFADHGARHIILTSRKGHLLDEHQVLIDELKRNSIEVHCTACDVTNHGSVKALVQSVLQSGKRIAGFSHLAMVLKDGLFRHLDVADLDRVMAPKILGAQVLDQVSRSLDLDYFFLFSSASTFIGNPGQAAYISANGFLEGLARKRKQEGLPALAIAWGAISDVGVLVKNRQVLDSLSERIGVVPMAARTCLDLLYSALNESLVEDPVLCLASLSWGAAFNRLKTLKCPVTEFMSKDHRHVQEVRDTLDLRLLLEEKTQEEVEAIVCKSIAEDISRILRIPIEDIGYNKPFSDIGLDSLMGIELGISLQERFTIDMQINGISSTSSVQELALSLVQRVINPNSAVAEPIERLMRVHMNSNDDRTKEAHSSAFVSSHQRESHLETAH